MWTGQIFFRVVREVRAASVAARALDSSMWSVWCDPDTGLVGCRLVLGAGDPYDDCEASAVQTRVGCRSAHSHSSSEVAKT
jgi:hypothetical protein